MSTESVMPPNHFILCHPLLFPSVLPSIKELFSRDSVHVHLPRLPLHGTRTSVISGVPPQPIQLYRLLQPFSSIPRSHLWLIQDKYFLSLAPNVHIASKFWNPDMNYYSATKKETNVICSNMGGPRDGRTA